LIHRFKIKEELITIHQASPFNLRGLMTFERSHKAQVRPI